VLEVEADMVRALLFDSEARRVEGYSAQLPRRAEAEADCLDEMHRLVHESGFRVGAVMGAAVTEQDRPLWPGFAGAAWLAALPEGVGAVLGSGCVGRERFALVIGAVGMLATISEAPVADLACMQIDEKRWLVAGAVPEAGGVYAALRHETKGSVEEFLENAAEDDPLLAPVQLTARRFREIFERLERAVGRPREVLACGSALLKSPAWTQRIADRLGVPLTLSTEAEPAGRGAALWALERIGAIGSLGALEASTGVVFRPAGS
jgi:sugar (pentulose or hexulose) kinase